MLPKRSKGSAALGSNAVDSADPQPKRQRQARGGSLAVDGADLQPKQQRQARVGVRGKRTTNEKEQEGEKKDGTSSKTQYKVAGKDDAKTVALATKLTLTLPQQLINRITREEEYKEIFEITDTQYQQVSREDVLGAAPWLHVCVTEYPGRVPSGFMYAAALLRFDANHEYKVLHAAQDPNTRERRAIEEADKLKRIHQQLRCFAGTYKRDPPKKAKRGSPMARLLQLCELCKFGEEEDDELEEEVQQFLWPESSGGGEKMSKQKLWSDMVLRAKRSGSEKRIDETANHMISQVERWRADRKAQLAVAYAEGGGEPESLAASSTSPQPKLLEKNPQWPEVDNCLMTFLQQDTKLMTAAQVSI